MSFTKITEQPSLYNNLETKTAEQLLREINTEDRKVAEVVEITIPQVAKLVELIVPRMKRGGRIFYMGAGTSGRLGVLDASELPPTFGVPKTLVLGLIAGGDTALRNAVENAEDDEEHGWEELTELNINEKHRYWHRCLGHYTLCGGRSSQCKRTRHTHGLHHKQPQFAHGCRKRCGHRNDCWPRIRYWKLENEIGNRTKNDS